MKKILLIVLVMALCLGMTAIAMAGVSGTPHDPRIFSSNAGGTVSHVCESCHTPHNAGTYPLWNRDRDGSTMTFAMYNSPTFDEGSATYATGAYVGYQSKLCFACHDGNTATIVNGPGTDDPTDYDITILNSDKILGNDLKKTHPVGFLVNLTNDTGGSGLNGLGFNTSRINGAASAGSPTFFLFPDPTGVSTTMGTFQCATCHTVHHTPDVSYSTTTEVYFLRIGNAASNMCRACHPTFY